MARGFSPGRGGGGAGLALNRAGGDTVDAATGALGSRASRGAVTGWTDSAGAAAGDSSRALQEQHALSIPIRAIALCTDHTVPPLHDLAEWLRAH